MVSRYLNKYNDSLLFLVLIPIINTINYHLTYSNPRWDWYTITTYLIDTASGFIAWWIIRTTVLWLDRTLPYDKNLVKRILLQILFTNIFAQGFIILQTEIVNTLFGDGPLPIEFYTENLFIFFIWILVINGIYIGMYFYDQWGKTAYLRERDKQLRSSGFEVQLGKSVLTVDFDEIAAFAVEGGFTYLITKAGKNFVIDASLNKIMLRLPDESFFRLNRKFIVERNMISGYTKAENGKLKASINLISDFPDSIIISRITAPRFKSWFRATVEWH